MIKYINMKIGIFGNWELSLEIRILKNYLKIEFKKKNK